MNVIALNEILLFSDLTVDHKHYFIFAARLHLIIILLSIEKHSTSVFA